MQQKLSHCAKGRVHEIRKPDKRNGGKQQGDKQSPDFAGHKI